MSEGVAVLEATGGLEVVKEAVDHRTPRHEGRGVVVPRGAEDTVGVVELGELPGIGHGGDVGEPTLGRRVEVLVVVVDTFDDDRSNE